MTKQEDWSDKKRKKMTSRCKKQLRWNHCLDNLSPRCSMIESQLKDLFRNGRDTSSDFIFWKSLWGGLYQDPCAPWGWMVWTKKLYPQKLHIKIEMSVQSISKEVLGLLDCRSSGVIEIGKLLLLEAPSCDFVIITNKRR